jgi:mannosylglycerate hydrolase
MKTDPKHIKQIMIVSNTHWDREFRRSFEKTRRALLTMMDITIDILEKDPQYHSFTMDGHCIMIDDYLEMRPEKTGAVKKLVSEGRLIIGPYYTLAEQFSISHEALVRNLIWGRKTIEKYGGKMGTVAYTPSSWGQTGQLPQILDSFGLKRMMFYRGISHHEADAEYIWSAPDGTRVMASRFAVYARYNWYYQVHRAITRDRVLEKDYIWGQYDELPIREADEYLEDGGSYELRQPSLHYDPSRLKKAIEDMVETEGRHFTTEVFLAMNGHDISAAHPLESMIIEDAKKVLGDKYRFEHTDLEGFWKEAEKHLDMDSLPVLTGERRAYLKEGMWTYLFPGTISTRTYLKQKDFSAYTKLVYFSEPLASMAMVLCGGYPSNYLDRGWRHLLSNHTHDANGGCAPDVVCEDMEYRYRVVSDVSDIVSEDSMYHIIENLSPEGIDHNALLLTVFNTLPFKRDALASLDIEVPRMFGARSVDLCGADGTVMSRIQPVASERSSVFIDSVWDVPTILDSDRLRFYAKLDDLPAMGYRTYIIKPSKTEKRKIRTMITGPDSMENTRIRVKVNADGTLDITNKKSGRKYSGLNYLSDQGEGGNAWKHEDLVFDKKYISTGIKASVAVIESGELTSAISAEYSFSVPVDYENGKTRNSRMTEIPVKMEYRLEKDSGTVKVRAQLNNTARDHWLRTNFPTGLKTDKTWADSHFDVVSRPIAIPDGTGWVEMPRGTHPLRTFVSMDDGKDGIALMPKGIFEYEAFEDDCGTLALTLIRACRIKLVVSNEKVTELRDEGIQCPGMQLFEYAINIFEGSWENGEILAKAAEYYAPVRSAASGRGRGKLPLEGSLFSLDSRNMHVTCVKKAEDGAGLVIRFFNPTDNEVTCDLTFKCNIEKAYYCGMDESITEEAAVKDGVITCRAGARKIITLKAVIG